MLVWTKLVPRDAEDAWAARLAFISPKLVTTAPSRARRSRLEAYHVTRAEANRLVTAFGGTIRLAKTRPSVPGQNRDRSPLRVRDKLLIASSLAQMQKLSKTYPDRKVACIPAGMAFGTGEHVTTLTCLRFLADVAGEFPGRRWSLLDLGCGTGILAIAASLLGAASADAWDFDPQAVRVAKENVRANEAGRVRVKRADALEWKSAGRWDVIAANLYSEILIRAAPAIRRALKDGGKVIFSGVLRVQEGETCQAFERAGFKIATVARQGKWIAGLASADLPQSKMRDKNPGARSAGDNGRSTSARP